VITKVRTHDTNEASALARERFEFSVEASVVYDIHGRARYMKSAVSESRSEEGRSVGRFDVIFGETDKELAWRLFKNVMVGVFSYRGIWFAEKVRDKLLHRAS